VLIYDNKLTFMDKKIWGIEEIDINLDCIKQNEEKNDIIGNSQIDTLTFKKEYRYI